MKLSGKSAIITGGAGGIGRASVLRYVHDGAKVLVADLDLAAAQSVVDEVDAAGFEGSAVAHAVDVSDFAEVERMVQAAVDAFGGVDIIFNNAGIAGGTPLL
ncbi:MAG: SDR family NAD(P)-dependent oxidoreductase, partial [Microbacterium sp.]